MTRELSKPDTSQLQELSSDKLFGELRRAIEITVEQIVRMAAIVKILEERGEDLSEIRLGMMAHLRLVAYGQLLPEALAKLQGAPFLLKRVASLPMPDQRQLIEKDSVEVVTPESPADSRNVPLLALAREEVFQVFGDGEVRDPGKQRSYLRDHVKKTRRRTQTDERVVFDKKRGGIAINGEFFSRKELTQLLARLDD